VTAPTEKQTRKIRSQAYPSADRGPRLPAWKAFVVQFSRESGRRAETVAGRVEHLSSGQRARFGSAEKLLAVLMTMLDGLGEVPYKREPPR